MTATHRKPRAAASNASPPAEPIVAVPEPMDPVDRAWLEMDDTHNPMVVASIMEFEGVSDVESLARRLVERMRAERRFRQRAVPSDTGYDWIEDDTLHFGYHARIRELDPPGTDTQLQAAIGAELGLALDRALPLWRICLFPRSGHRVTVLFRAHHAIGDGVALMKLLLHLADGGPATNGGTAPDPGARPHGPLGKVIRGLESVNSVLENLTELAIDDLRHPGKFMRQVGEVRRTLTAVGRVVLLPDDNPPRFRVPPGGRRAVAWTSNLSFAAVRKLAHAQGVTINDVFLTALAGAFGRYLRKVEGSVPEGQNLRVSVPVNLRAPDDATLGNTFGLVLLDLPVGLEGWHARLDVIADRMASLKQSSEARAVLVALAAAGHLPPVAERQLVGLVGNKAAAVVSNLPGPRRALGFGSARLANMVFWPPQTAGIGIGVSFLSYAGHVTVGISADRAHIAHPQDVIDAFCAELESMLGYSPAVRHSGNGRRPRPSPTARSATGVNNHAKT